MAFTVHDFDELVRLLKEHPEWREELRRLVLADELFRLPALLQELAHQTQLLAQAQRQTEAQVQTLGGRVEALTARVEALAEAQRHTETRVEALAARMEALAARVEALAEAQRETEARVQALTSRVEALTARVEALAEAQRHTETRMQALAARMEALAARVEALAEAQRRTEQGLAELAESTDRRFREVQAQLDAVVGDLGQLKGDNLEHLYRERASSYFRRVFTHLRVLQGHELDQVLVAAAEGAVITWEERDEVLRADLSALGRLRSTGQEAYLVAEVSWGVGPRDVERAYRRAEILGRASGLAAAAAVGGRSILPEAAQLAENLGVALVIDGAMQA